MKILVTGGCGFIGSHLSDALLAHGHEVFVIDDLSTGSMDNVKHLRQSPNFHPFYESIMNEKLLLELINQCDTVFHLAAVVGVKKVISSPVETIERNIKGTDLVLKFANLKKRKVILMSTSEVYGKGNLDSFSETDDLTLGSTTIQRWSYACSKAIDEFLTLAYFREYKLPIVILRLFNVIGPRQTGRYGMVVPTFIHQALKNEPLTIFGNGEQTRCFLYVQDAVEAMIQIGISEQAVGEIINLGNPKAIKIIDLAHLIIDITGSKSTIKYIPYEQCYDGGFEDMQRRVPNIQKIQSLIKFEPKVQLKEIIKKIIESNH